MFCMTQYTVKLTYVDGHFHGEEFVKEILKLSNSTNDDGRPIFVTYDLFEAIRVIHEAYEICRRYSAGTELNIKIVPNEVKDL